MNHAVYLLKHKDEYYCGYTNHLRRRLRQHRKEIKGGAEYTREWTKDIQLVCYVRGFPSRRDGLIYEHEVQHGRAPPLLYHENQDIPAPLFQFFTPFFLPKLIHCLDRLEVVLVQHQDLKSVLVPQFHLQTCRLSEEK